MLTEKPKVTPYRTRTGIEIGKWYTPKREMEYTADMELLQCALLNDPDFLRRVKARNIFYTVSVIAFFTFAAIFIR